MFVNETYSIDQLARKFNLPSAQVELGLRRAGVRAIDSQRALYSYEAVWHYVHKSLNSGHFAAWEHNIERVPASELTGELIDQIALGWPEDARAGLDKLLALAHASPDVFLMLHRILHIDPECPACGHFPWIVGYDGRQARKGIILGIYVCPGCGYLFCRR
jgi:hypothetical protein